MGIHKKYLTPQLYCKDIIDFSMKEKVYNWVINGEEYSGTLLDFFSEYRYKDIQGDSCCDVESIKKGYKNFINSLSGIYSHESVLAGICPVCNMFATVSWYRFNSGGFKCKQCSTVKGLSIADNEKVKALYLRANNIFPPESIPLYSQKDVKFKCSVGHEFYRPPSSIVRNGVIGEGCPICNNSLNTTNFLKDNPKAASMWDYTRNGINPEDVARSSGKYYWFVCPEGHSFQSSPNILDRRRNSVGFGCPECYRLYKLNTYNLASRYPTIYKYWDDRNPEDPADVMSDPEGINSDILYWVHCDFGHVYKQSACKIGKSFNKDGIKRCPVCSGQFLQSGVNDLKTLMPKVAECWDYERNTFLPEDYAPFSHKPAWFKCVVCGRSVYYKSINDRSKSAGYCKDCASKFNQSLTEKELINYVTSLGFEVKTDKTLGDMHYKYDMYIAEMGLLIEYNGVYYHSEAVHTDKMRHYKKYAEAKNAGLDLFVIWEDDYKRNPDLIKRMLRNRLNVSTESKVNARDCIVVYPDTVSAKVFLNENHIQMSGGLNTYLALSLNGFLVAVMAYFVKDGVATINRYATSCNVRGGFSKLLKVLSSNDELTAIETFSDNSISDGGLYKNSGFVITKHIKPDYSYLYKGRERVHKFNLRKKAFQKDVNLVYKEGMSEAELAELNGLYRIWDYGKKKWRLDLTL